MPVWIGDGVETPFPTSVEVVSGILLTGLLELDTHPGIPGSTAPSYVETQ